MSIAPRSRRLALLLAAGIAVMALLACQRESTTVELTQEEMAHLRLRRLDPNHGRPVRPLMAEFEPEEGTGEVVSVDRKALTVAIRHRQRSKDDWPGMVMNFRVRRSLLDRLRPGEQIYFKAAIQDEAGEILDVSPVPGHVPAQEQN